MFAKHDGFWHDAKRHDDTTWRDCDFCDVRNDAVAMPASSVWRRADRRDATLRYYEVHADDDVLVTASTICSASTNANKKQVRIKWIECSWRDDNWKQTPVPQGIVESVFCCCPYSRVLRWDFVENVLQNKCSHAHFVQSITNDERWRWTVNGQLLRLMIGFVICSEWNLNWTSITNNIAIKTIIVPHQKTFFVVIIPRPSEHSEIFLESI